MQEFTPLDPAERELEKALGSLQPRPISEQEVWYQAGLKAGRRRANFWRIGAAAAVLAALSALIPQRGSVPVTVDRYVYIPQQPAPRASARVDESTAPPMLPAAYLRLRDAIEGNGWQGLAATEPQPSASATEERIVPLRPIDETSPALWQIVQNRG